MQNFKLIREKYRSKYPASLVAAAVKIALDMAGNMTGAYKKIEAMKRGLADDKIVKDALRQANEQKEDKVNENYAQDLDLAQKNMARLAKQEKGQEKKDYMAVARALNQGNLGAVKKVIKGISTDEIKADILNVLVGYNDLIAKMYPKAVDGKGRLKSGMTVGKMIKDDTAEAVSPEEKAQLALKHAKEKEALQKRQEREKENMKDEAVSPAQQAAIAIAKKKAKAKLLRRESTLSEAMSKKISDREARAIQKKYNLSLDQMQDMKNDYSPAKSARPRAWLSLNYPVRDGDYYFAFISSSEKDNIKYNNLLNDVIKKAAKEVPAGEKPTDKADYIWDKASDAVKKFPRALGWNDTMTREEIWASIGHLIGVREEIEEIALDKMRVGKRKKAPKWS